MRILVVEDDASIRETLGMVLESNGHHALLVENGEQALLKLSSEWPDAMLLDLTLPGMAGEEVYQAVRDQFGRVPPTVVLSASQGGAKRAHFMEGTMYLAKPYTIDALEQMIQEITCNTAA
jgi:DNA-binding response OmpR family regulator